MRTRGPKLGPVLHVAMIYFIIILVGCGVLNLAEAASFLSRRVLSTSSAERTAKSPQPAAGLFSDLTSAPTGNSTQKITDDDPNTEVYATLIDAFEKLGLVTPRQQTCYTVKKIIREVFAQSRDKPQRILGVYLYIEESILQADPAYSTGEDRVRTSNQPSPTSTDSNTTSVTSENDKEAGCKSSPVIVITGADRMKKTNSSSATAADTSANSTGGMISAKAVNDDTSGLSRTQVMVISTCSAVIGTFFLVAAIMRIRNYVKRTREGRNNNQRSDRNPYRGGYTGGFRESGSPLRGHNTRTSSGSGSPERQINSIGNSKDSVLYSRQSGDNSCEPLLSLVSQGEDKPMLVITSASASNSPSSSAQGSQEEITTNHRNKKDCEKDNNNRSEDDGLDIENKPLLSNMGEISVTPDLHGVTFPFIDSSSVVKESNQKLESTGLDGVIPDQSIPSDLADIVMSDPDPGISPENDSAEIGLGARGLAGLSQSDSSLSSNNPSYRYGNQVEYVTECGDGYDPYCPALSDEDFLHVADTEENSSSAVPHSHRQPFIPQFDSFDSLSAVSIIPSDMSFDMEERKMTPIEELPPPPPELFRGLSLEDPSSFNTNNNVPPYNEHLSNDNVNNTAEQQNTESVPFHKLHQNSTDSMHTHAGNSSDTDAFTGGPEFLDSCIEKTLPDRKTENDVFACEIETVPVSPILSSDRTSLL